MRFPWLGASGVARGAARAATRYAAHYAEQVAINTAADTAWDIGVNGRNAGDAFMQSLAGNAVGQVMGDGLSAGLRRALPGAVRAANAMGLPMCFVAGTLVQLGTADGEEPKFAPIEELRLGQRTAGENPLGSPRQVEEPTPANWRTVSLRAVNREDADVVIKLLRPLTWLAAAHAAPGAVIDVDIPELNLSGKARVLSISDCPPIEPGLGNVITGTFQHVAGNLLDVFVEGLNEPIGCTERHPFWSVTRLAFIEARELRTGERLLGTDGVTAQVVSVSLSAGSESVYNLEILGPHVYRVSPLGLLVHNASWAQARGANFVADAGVFLDRVPPGNRAVLDDVLALGDLSGVLPKSIRREVSGAPDIARMLAARAQVLPVRSANVADILRAHPSILSRKFGVNDLKLLATAKQLGLPIVTTNSKLIDQIQGDAARRALFGNVRILVPGRDFSSAADLKKVLGI